MIKNILNVNIFNMSNKLRDKVTKKSEFTAFMSLLFFALTGFSLAFMFTEIHIGSIYITWGFGGLIITRKDWNNTIIIILTLPLAIWMFVNVYLVALYYYSKSATYTVKEFFYNDEFDDYTKQL